MCKEEMSLHEALGISDETVEEIANELKECINNSSNKDEVFITMSERYHGIELLFAMFIYGAWVERETAKKLIFTI